MKRLLLLMVVQQVNFDQWEREWVILIIVNQWFHVKTNINIAISETHAENYDNLYN